MIASAFCFSKLLNWVGLVTALGIKRVPSGAFAVKSFLAIGSIVPEKQDGCVPVPHGWVGSGEMNELAAAIKPASDRLLVNPTRTAPRDVPSSWTVTRCP